MENSTGTVREDEHFRVQLDLFALIEPCPAPAVQPTDHAPAAEAGSPEEQPAGDPAIASAAGIAEPLGGVVPHASVEAVKPNADPESVPDPIPPRGLIPVKTGREAMKRRAARLYSTIATLNGLTTLDLWVEGEPLVVDSKTIKKLRSVSMAVDKVYRDAIKNHRVGNTVNVRREHRRAWDRARQEVKRALGDLVTIFAADEVEDQETGERTGYKVYRLPEVRHRQLAHGAMFARKRPGGGRVVVDRAGDNAGRQSPVHSRPVQRPESQVPEVVAGRDDNA
jgi:hypothetical protein